MKLHTGGGAVYIVPSVPAIPGDGGNMAEEIECGGYEAPTLTMLGTLSELTAGSSLNIAGDFLLQASASIIHIEP